MHEGKALLHCGPEIRVMETQTLRRGGAELRRRDERIGEERRRRGEEKRGEERRREEKGEERRGEERRGEERREEWRGRGGWRRSG